MQPFKKGPIPRNKVNEGRKYGKPVKTFTPYGMLVALYAHRTDVTQGGILLPDGVEDPSATPTAEVIAVGGECKWVKEGDIVLVHELVKGHHVFYKGNKYFMVREESLSGVLLPGNQGIGPEDSQPQLVVN